MGGGANRRPVEPPLRCHNLSRLGLQRFMGFSATKKLHILYRVQDKGNFNWMPRFVRSIHHVLLAILQALIPCPVWEREMQHMGIKKTHLIEFWSDPPLLFLKRGELAYFMRLSCVSLISNFSFYLHRTYSMSDVDWPNLIKSYPRRSDRRYNRAHYAICEWSRRRNLT